MKFKNYLIDENYVIPKLEESTCIIFNLPNDKALPNLEIKNSEKKLSFYISEINENFYKGNTLLTLGIPIYGKVIDKEFNFADEIIDFYNKWHYSNKEKFEIFITDLKEDTPANFFKKPLKITKENFFIEGFTTQNKKTNLLVVRILLDHSNL